MCLYRRMSRNQILNDNGILKVFPFLKNEGTDPRTPELHVLLYDNTYVSYYSFICFPRDPTDAPRSSDRCNKTPVGECLPHEDRQRHRSTVVGIPHLPFLHPWPPTGLRSYVGTDRLLVSVSPFLWELILSLLRSRLWILSVQIFLNFLFFLKSWFDTKIEIQDLPSNKCVDSTDVFDPVNFVIRPSRGDSLVFDNRVSSDLAPWLDDPLQKVHWGSLSDLHLGGRPLTVKPFTSGINLYLPKDKTKRN